ncbi:hypothetical protein HF264_17070 [Rhizobium leguminosarum]|uniref:hypothetical protein n=1 Tax=Rhizobium TaxID=379 RepID=UPI001C91C96C|nr:hypothetical protein [Rhizobium leguminosarum]MBY2941406.1 hypothetical protein [Rhizobium leguminosarum]
MDTYYHRSREGQDSYANFTVEIPSDNGSKNASFATNSVLGNQAEAPTAQAVAAVSAAAGVVQYEHPAPTPPSPSTTPAYLPLVKERLAGTPKPRGRHARKRKPITKAWVRLSPAEKLEATFDRAFQREAIAFSLNFSGKRIAKLAASADPARDLSCAINRVAKAVLGYRLPLAFSFEFTDDDRLHCHGVAILPDWEQETVNRFRQVLKGAGGMMHGLGSGRQVDVKVLTDCRGWNGYRLKDADWTVERLGTAKIEYVSRELGRIAREDHDAELARRKSRKTTHRRPASAKKASASLTHSPVTKTRQRAAVSQSPPEAGKSTLTDTNYLKTNDKLAHHPLTAIHKKAMNCTSTNFTHKELSNYMPQYILDATTYSRLMEALLAASADAHVSQDADLFKIALGEIAGIWPDSVLEAQPAQDFRKAA